MNIVISGGAGFIGQSLCENILENSNAQLLCIDNFSTGDRLSIDDLTKKYGPTRVGLVTADVEGHQFVINEAVRGFFCNQKIDRIYHLACPASPSRYQIDPVKTLMTSVVGTKNMLDLATRHNARILFTSTSEVYGDPEVNIQSEEYKGNVNCTGTRACYDEGKRAGESLCFDYNRTYGTKIKVVRIFNTYGPGMQPDDGRVVSNFVVQALKGDDITIYGDGTQTRSFCFVEDMVTGLKSMMDTPLDVIGPINIGNPKEITVKQLADSVLSLINSQSRVVYRDLPEDDPKKRCPSITKALRCLSWTPMQDLSEGLPKTIEYFRSRVEDQ